MSPRISFQRFTYLLSTVTAVVSAIPLSSPQPIAAVATRQTSSTPLCSYGTYGIICPSANKTITQIDDGSESATYFEVIYCSGQYFETSSLNVDVWLSSPGEVSSSGIILIEDATPDNQDAEPGYYSYRLNVSITPEDGDYATGARVLSVYERESGMLLDLHHISLIPWAIHHLWLNHRQRERERERNSHKLTNHRSLQPLQLRHHISQHQPRSRENQHFNIFFLNASLSFPRGLFFSSGGQDHSLPKKNTEATRVKQKTGLPTSAI